MSNSNSYNSSQNNNNFSSLNEENQIRKKSITQFNLQQQTDQLNKSSLNTTKNNNQILVTTTTNTNTNNINNISNNSGRGKNENEKRELNVATALRLIREVAKARSANGIEKKNPRTQYSIGDEPNLILHDVETMYKEAQSAYFYKLRNTKDNGLIPAAKPKTLRPISANMIAEIMRSEQQRIDEETQMNVLKETKLKLRKLQQEAWGNDPSSPLYHHHHQQQHQHHSHPHHNIHHNHNHNQDMSNLELDTMLSPGRVNTGRVSEASSGYGFKEKERKSDASETNHIKGRSENDKNRETKVMLSQPCQRKPSRRDTTTVQKIKEAQLQGEETRRRSIIEEKKKRVIDKVPISDQRMRQQFWTLAFCKLTRIRYLMCILEENRVRAWTANWKRKEIKAIRIIELFWKSFRLVSKIRKNPKVASKIRVCIMVGWRKRKIAKINAARELVYQFLRDISGVSDRTQKVYRYRAKIVKLQRYLRSYLQCQHARILLLWLAFQKELAKQRVLRNKEINATERNSVRKMKRSKFFGPTVQKLDEVYTTLSTLMYQKNQIYKTLIQKQKHIEHINTSLGIHSPGHLKSPNHLSNSHHQSIHSPTNRNNNHTHRIGGNKFHGILLNVLHNQRKRYILINDSESNKNSYKRLEKQAVADADVKEFLKTPNHPGPNYVQKTMNDTKIKKSNLFLLLTLGGLRELESVAHNVVLAEDHERKEKGSSGRSLADSNHSGSLDGHHTNRLLRSNTTNGERESGLDFDDNYEDDD